MMTSRDRHDLLYVLVQNYVIDKRSSQVYGRENSSAYTHSKGMLQGALMAFQLDMEENKNEIIIMTRKNHSFILVYKLDE